MDSATPEFKLLLLGDSGVGKTTYIKKHLTGQYEKSYTPTKSIEIHPVKFNTNHGPIIFNVWEISGENYQTDISEIYLIEGQCAIIMFDVTSKLSYKSVPKLHRDILRICDDIPLVLVGNKVEQKPRKILASQITYHKRHSIQYYDISVKANHQTAKPFIWLARQITHWHDLIFLESASKRSIEVVYSSNVRFNDGEDGDGLERISEREETGSNANDLS